MSEAMKNPLRYEPDYALAPGETLAERLDELDMDQRELAIRLRMSAKCVNQMIRGKAPITHETAIKLERVTGIPSHVWNNLEMNYRSALARLEDHKRLGVDADWEWLKTIPTKELIARHVFEEPSDRNGLLNAVLEFFGVANRQAWEAVWNENRAAAAWRKSVCFDSHPGPTATWLRLGELQAQGIRCEPFDKVKFVDALAEIRKLTAAGPEVFGPKMIELCAQAGVALVFVPEIKGCPASGAARWLTPEKALIQLSLRYKSDDHFWFSFFHEAGHILHDPKKSISIDEPNQDGGEREMKANRFAADYLIPPAEVASLRQLRTVADITAFARRIGVAPGIVVGRLQHDGRIRRFQFNNLKVKLVWKTLKAG
ncbi:MAG: ImmA/IrrE family metallo-endopeptidase [Planctomycetes bacterium]|jgi:HTH-type transcriptional regulator/antitoxin HigA|nr:ImmA/IrrE family metallo-endopeptidase [Planctomycetota bacterium]